MNNALKILIITLAFGSCHNEYAIHAEEVCQCFEKSKIAFTSESSARKKSIVSECLNKKIENLAAAAEGSEKLDALFNSSLQLSIELKSNCAFFQQHQEEIVKLLKSKENQSSPVQKVIPTEKEVSGQITSIHKLDEYNNEFNLQTNDGTTLTFFYKKIPNSYRGKTVTVAYDEKMLDEELILWVKRLELED